MPQLAHIIGESCNNIEGLSNLKENIYDEATTDFDSKYKFVVGKFRDDFYKARQDVFNLGDKYPTKSVQYFQERRNAINKLTKIYNEIIKFKVDVKKLHDIETKSLNSLNKTTEKCHKHKLSSHELEIFTKSTIDNAKYHVKIIRELSEIAYNASKLADEVYTQINKFEKQK